MQKPLSSRRWLLLFVGTALVIFLSVVAFNFLTDPFGAFGDPVMQWWSYDETVSPGVAKISYLENHWEDYDAYILGASSSSSIPVEALNGYTGAHFYNLFVYGGNMQAAEETVNYLLRRDEVKHLVLSVYLASATKGDYDRDSLTDGVHWRVSGESPLRFALRYLLSDPRVGWEKLWQRSQDGFLQTPYKVFDVATGSYDKSLRDVENIGDLEEYLSRPAYRGFTTYPHYGLDLTHLEDFTQRVARIKATCEEAGVELLVLCPPMYHEYLTHFTPEEQATFRRALSAVTDYWDFTLSAASYDPRYFYDETHFRNDLGRMMLARLFGEEGVYLPEGLGDYIPQGSDPGPYTGAPVPAETYTAQVPILMYHHLAEEAGDMTVTPARFREQLTALQAAGYEAVSFSALQAYVLHGAPLPEKPLVITFDDGYLSNYTLAYPILKELNLKATIFPIGVSLGKDTYKDTGVPMLPHFTLEQAAEMEASGLIDIESHGYNLHEVEGRDPPPIRAGAQQRPGEKEEAYVAFLRQDAATMQSLLPEPPTVLAYPFGKYSQISEVVFSQSGIAITLTVSEHPNTLIQGLPQSLRLLGRYTVTEDISGEALIRRLK